MNLSPYERTILPLASPQEKNDSRSYGGNELKEKTSPRRSTPTISSRLLRVWIVDSGNRHRPSFEADSNRDGLCRSPGLRFSGSKLPSQRSHASGIACLFPHRLQWRGRAGFSPASQTIQSLEIYTAAFRNQSRTPSWVASSRDSPQTSQRHMKDYCAASPTLISSPS